MTACKMSEEPADEDTFLDEFLTTFIFEEAAHKHMCLQKATIRRAEPLARKMSYCSLVLAYILAGAHPELF